MKSNNEDGQSLDYEEYAARWRFRVPVDGSTRTERFEAMLSVVESLIDIFDPLLKPTHVDYNLKSYGGDDADDIEDDITDSDGVSFDQLSRSIRSHEDADNYRLTPVGFHGPITVQLRDGTHEIGVNSDRYYQLCEDSVPSEPPIRISISQVGFMLPDDEYEFLIEIVTHTNIWFKEDECGAVNREQLASVLSDVNETFDPYVAEISSEDYYWKLEDNYPELFFSYQFPFTEATDDNGKST